MGFRKSYNLGEIKFNKKKHSVVTLSSHHTHTHRVRVKECKDDHGGV